MMHEMRRMEKAIADPAEVKAILARVKYVTVAMCGNGEPYLVTLSHGYDPGRNCIYFHCAREGKKIEILSVNNTVWGQAIDDGGYVDGKCDHLYSSVHFHGSVTFVENDEEKRRALAVMIRQLEPDPEPVLAAQVTNAAVAGVNIGRIDIDFMSGKRSSEVIVSL